MATSIFVYGTLMFDPVARLVTGRSFASRVAYASGFERRCVVGKPYPGLIESVMSHASVEGRLWFDVDEASLARLDYYEDDFYERREISVRCSESLEHRASCYLVPADLAHVLGKPWDPEVFRLRQLPAFLRELGSEASETSSAMRRASDAAERGAKRGPT